MGRMRAWMVLMVLAGSLSACGTPAPGSKLETYLGTEGGALGSEGRRLDSSSRVGLVVLQDTSAKGTVPPLSQAGLEALTRETRAQLEGGLAVRVAEVLPPSEAILDAQGRLPLQDLARRHSVEWMAVAVYSAVEVEDPQPLTLDGTRGGGGAMGRLPGTVTSVYALAELALVDVASGQRVAQSQGRASASLEQLARGMASNAFPAIYRGGGQQRITAPQQDAEAHDLLRSIAFEDALRGAVYDLERWRNSRTIP